MFVLSVESKQASRHDLIVRPVTPAPFPKLMFAPPTAKLFTDRAKIAQSVKSSRRFRCFRTDSIVVVIESDALMCEQRFDIPLNPAHASHKLLRYNFVKLIVGH
jgi:hypothetical protein